MCLLFTQEMKSISSSTDSGADVFKVSTDLMVSHYWIVLLKQSRFINYFGGPCVMFGQLLYSRLFGENKMDSTNDEDTEETVFIAALSKLRKASSK